MKTIKAAMLVALLLSFSQIASAKSSAGQALKATPIGSPADWLSPDDYPATALRYEMTGITAFTLSVDAAGRPQRCEITESSGFDVLDTATCQRLTANARFAPAHDRTGKPVEGTYKSRVRWSLPEGDSAPVTEVLQSMLLSVDRTGNITMCRNVFHLPTGEVVPSEESCGPAPGMMMPPALAMEIRGNYQGSLAEIEIQQAIAFTPEFRARVLAPMPGYEQRGLNIHRFTVTRDGKFNQCSYEEQRGDSRLADDYCRMAHDDPFDPPFSAFDKDGVATGWHIARVLLKAGG